MGVNPLQRCCWCILPPKPTGLFSLCQNKNTSHIVFTCAFYFLIIYNSILNLLWPRKGSLMKTQTRILDNKLYYTRKIELHRKGKKSRTVRITPIVTCPVFVAASHQTRLDTRSKARRPIKPIVTCPSGSEISVLITVRRVHYSKMGKVPTTEFKFKKNYFKRKSSFLFFLL